MIEPVPELGAKSSNPPPADDLASFIREARMSMNEAPEFKGNVKTFRTDLLVAKTDEELSATSGQNAELWKKTGGDASYHYYGSAIWFTRIGHAMGESMLELMKGKP